MYDPAEDLEDEKQDQYDIADLEDEQTIVQVQNKNSSQGTGPIQFGLAEPVQVNNISDQQLEYQKQSKQVQQSQKQYQQLLEQVELERKAKASVVPTHDPDVKKVLRQLEQPITLFGELALERRARLQKIVAQLDSSQLKQLEGLQVKLKDQYYQQQDELFFTEGDQELLRSRQEIALWSLKKSQDRLKNQRKILGSTDVLKVVGQKRVDTLDKCQQMDIQSSEFADTRPIQCCQFHPKSDLIATAGWSGKLKLWNQPQCMDLLSIQAHEDRCVGLAWHPEAPMIGVNDSTGDGMISDIVKKEEDCNNFKMEIDEIKTFKNEVALSSKEEWCTQIANASKTLAIATSSADCTCKMWSIQGQKLQELKGHQERVARIAFHPMGKHLASASYDGTWRLWDVNTGQCLLEQEGHSRQVYTVAFHPDGSLVASGGLDGVGRIWDCRTGRSILVLTSHVRAILSLDFACDGIRFATGSMDHSVKLWDLRRRASFYTFPAHSSLVSVVKFDPSSNGIPAYLMTGGYDRILRIWSLLDYSHVRTLSGHEGRVMGGDIRGNRAEGMELVVASSGYDRTLKLWSPRAYDVY